MFVFFEGASLKMARNLIKVTGLAESLAVIQKNTYSNIGEGDVLKLLLGMDACNLIQTMKEDFIKGEIGEEDLQDTVEDYLVENLKPQTVIPCRDGAERMEQCQEILKIAEKFQEYWAKEEFKDPGPRFFCVKELLGRLGCESNTPIHDNLFEFVYEQHNRFIRYFRTLLEPFQEEESSEVFSEPPPLAVSIHGSSPEPPSPAEPVEGERRISSLTEPFRGGTPGSFQKPMPQLLDELFQKVNPIDGDFSGEAPRSEPLSGSPDPGHLTEEGIATEALAETPAELETPVENSPLEVGKIKPDEDFLNIETKS